MNLDPHHPCSFFRNARVVKSHCMIFPLLLPCAPKLLWHVPAYAGFVIRLPCKAQQCKEDLVLFITQLFLLSFQFNIILLHLHAATLSVTVRDVKCFYRSTWSTSGCNSSCGRSHDCRAESTHATCRQAPCAFGRNVSLLNKTSLSVTEMP